MTNQTIDKAMEIFAKLITKQEINNRGENISLYESYTENSEVYDLVGQLFHSLDLNIYQFNNGLYVSPGENNRVFGYTNEELRNELGVRLNRELYLCYFIIYNIIVQFYTDSATFTYREYVKIDDIVEAVNLSFGKIFNETQTIVVTEIEEYSFKEIAMIWEDMPLVLNENNQIRADKSSRTGLTKRVFKFLISEQLFIQVEDMYYPTDRLKALIEHYFEENRSRIYEILTEGDKEDATY